MKKNLLITSFMIVLLSSCNMSAQEKYEAQFYATQYAKDPANIPPPKYQTLAATALNYYFNVPVGTPTPNPNWTPTLSAMEWSVTQAAQVQYSALTAQAQQQAFELEKLQAERAAQNADNTAVAARSTAEAYSLQQTAEARAAIAATNVASTSAAAIATNDYIHLVDGQNTAVAMAATNAVLPTHAVWTQAAVYAIQTIEQGEADKVGLAVKRQQLQNGFQALVPWLAFIGITFAVTVGFNTFIKTRVHPRDEHGRTQILQMRADNGDTVIIRPELMESATMKIAKDGAIVRYEPMDKQEQSDINRRTLAVEAIAALPTPYAQTGGKIVTSEFNTTRSSRITIGNDHSMGSVLDEADQGFLEEAKND